MVAVGRMSDFLGRLSRGSLGCPGEAAICDGGDCGCGVVVLRVSGRVWAVVAEGESMDWLLILSDSKTDRISSETRVYFVPVLMSPEDKR
jgi:hypothetical protein